MNSNRFKKIEENYHAALEISPEKQGLFLENKCGEDIELRKEVELLLSFENNSHSFIDDSPEDLAAEMFSEKEDAQKNLVNKKIGRYQVKNIIGEGGMGTVYLAQDTRLARLVALKVLPAEMVENEDRVQRFMHEARSASALNHPHILTVYEIDEFSQNDSEKIHFISMEYVEGVTLLDFIFKQKQSITQLLKYLEQVAKGLAKAHSAGIVHRDLKPENIMVSNDGYAKILDFGLAKLTDKENELHKLQGHKSRSGVIMGTVGYMSPEQAQGKSDIDERSDIFSFGCILYEAITKQRAFLAENTIDALHQIIHSEPTPIADLLSGISVELINLVDKCLQKNPENRFRHIKDIVPILQGLAIEDFVEKQTLRPADVQPTAILDKAATTPTISRQFSEQRRQVTVMFADFSAISEMLEDVDPEESSQMMKDLWSFLDDLVLKGGGRIGERLADTFLAIWGTDSISESDPEKSVHTALELQRSVSSYFNTTLSQEIVLSEVEKEELELTRFVKVGISTGTVLVGNSSDTGEFITTGSAVNLAKRLLSNASIGEIFVSHDTYRHIRGVFNVEEIKSKGGLSFKRKKQHAKTYSIKSVKPRAFRLESRGVEGIETMLVGREAELIKMLDALDAVTEDKELQIVTVVGEAGLGKSRLLFEFQDQIELLPNKFFVLKARALETMQGLPYSLIRDLFLFRFEIQESDSQSIAREKFVNGILEMTSGNSDKFGKGDEAEMKAHIIGHLVGLDFSESPNIKGIIDDEKQVLDRAMFYIAQFFSAVSQQLPLIFYLDDLHWADDESLNIIDFIAQQSIDEAILITEFTRPILFERRPHWGEGQENRIRLNLQPLTKRDSRKLIKNILQKMENVPSSLRDLLVSNTEGNPFYIEELIKMFIEQGAINTAQETWIVDTNRLSEISIPPSLTGVLQSRLDKLSHWEKRILRRASVIGREFWENSLGIFEEGVNVHTILESLRKKELLFRKESSSFVDTNEYIFKHALLRDVTYETVLLDERKQWHLETAEWLIVTGSERENEYLAVIAEHFEKAKKFEKAANWYGKAGTQARRSYALEIAETYFLKALEFWESVPETKETNITPLQAMKWKGNLGGVVFNQARFSEAIVIYNELLETAKNLDDKLGQASANYELSYSYFEFGDTPNSLECAKEVVRLAKEYDFAISDESIFLISNGLYRQGRALISLGKFDEAILIAEKIMEVSKNLKGSYSRPMANGLHLLAGANLYLGRFKEAQKFEIQEVELSRAIGDKRTLGNGLNSLGFQSYMQGYGKESIRYYEEALEIAREVGNKTGEIMVKSNIGGAKVYLEEYESAEIELKQIIAEVGDKGHFLIPETYRFLTESLIGQSKFNEALETAKKSLALSEESENHETTAEAWRVLGIISSSAAKDIFINEQGFSASDCFKKSLDIFIDNKMEANYAQALHNFAQHEFAKGNSSKADQLLKTEREISSRLDINTEAKSIYFKEGV